MKIDGQLFESRADAAVLLELADALLDYRAAAVGSAVEPHAAVAAVVAIQLVFLVRNDRLDARVAQPVWPALHAIALVPGEFPGRVPSLDTLVGVRSGTPPPGR